MLNPKQCRTWNANTPSTRRSFPGFRHIIPGAQQLFAEFDSTPAQRSGACSWLSSESFLRRHRASGMRSRPISLPSSPGPLVLQLFNRLDAAQGHVREQHDDVQRAVVPAEHTAHHRRKRLERVETGCLHLPAAPRLPQGRVRRDGCRQSQCQKPQRYLLRSGWICHCPMAVGGRISTNMLLCLLASSAREPRTSQCSEKSSCLSESHD